MALPRQQNMRTPPYVIRALEAWLGWRFKLDAFATKHNAVCKKYLTVKDNGFVHPWVDKTFANPPWRQTARAMEQAYKQADRLHSVVLAPAGCAQSWLHNYCKEFTIGLPDCRINYLLPNGQRPIGPDGKPTGAMWSTMVYMFGPSFRCPTGQQWNFVTIPIREYRDA